MKNHDLLHASSERQAELSSSIDGATLTRSLGFVAAGVRLIDVGCKYPVSKEMQIYLLWIHAWCKVRKDVFHMKLH